jgi:hypothetical protein
MATVVIRIFWMDGAGARRPAAPYSVRIRQAGYWVYDELVSVSRHASGTAGAASQLTVTYTYDALGHRVSERKLEAPGAMLSKSFLHDGEHVAAEAQTNASDALAEPRRYTRTDDDDDLAAIKLSAGNGAVSPTAEATGEDAPGCLLLPPHQSSGLGAGADDEAGAAANEYSYDSYSRPETAIEAPPQPFRFTGREYDPDTGPTTAPAPSILRPAASCRRPRSGWRRATSTSLAMSGTRWLTGPMHPE